MECDEISSAPTQLSEKTAIFCFLTFLVIEANFNEIHSQSLAIKVLQQHKTLFQPTILYPKIVEKNKKVSKFKQKSCVQNDYITLRIKFNTKSKIYYT